MYATYDLMYRCTNSTYLNKELEVLCDEYLETENAGKRNKIIAAMFCKLFNMILEIQKKYYSITNEQKAEHALFHLIRSIKYYNKKCKFSTFYYTHLTNQMKTLLTSQNNLKRAVFQNLVTDNDRAMVEYAKTEPSKLYEESETYFLKMLKRSDKLSSEEKDYCACYLAGYDKTKIITQKMLKANNLYVTLDRQVPLKEQLQKFDEQYSKHIKKIRANLKEKYKKYGSDLFC